MVANSLFRSSRLSYLAVCVALATSIGACSSDDKKTNATDAGNTKDAATADSGNPVKDAGVTDTGTGDSLDSGNPNMRTSSPADIKAACEFMVKCDSIPGVNLTEAYCEEHVTDECVECGKKNPGMQHNDDAGDDAGSCTPPGGPCSESCGLLTQKPTNHDECIEVAKGGASPVSDAYASCLCGKATDTPKGCGDIFTSCIADEGCWKIVLCAVKVHCNGMACYQSPGGGDGPCKRVIDEVGATSPSTSLSTELGGCTSKCPDFKP